MAARSSWKGFLRLSLVSIPVKAYTATASGSEIHLNQIHADCHSRIKYQKVCPIHGELTSDAIVSGYEFAKGQFVVIDPDELDKLRTESDKAIQIDAFIEPGRLDPAYFNGRTYYLVPDGPVGQKPYVLLHEGMKELDRVAMAQVVMHGKEQVVMVRPLDKLLAMSMMNFDAQVVKPASFADEVPEQKLSDAELDLVKTLISSQSQRDFDFAKYQDQYTQKLTQLIEAKVQGKEIVSPPAHEEAQVINLMEALKQSVARAQQQPEAGDEAAPPKKMAKSQPRKPAERKRKTS